MDLVPREDFGSFSSYRSEWNHSRLPGDTASVRSVVGSCGIRFVAFVVRLSTTREY